MTKITLEIKTSYTELTQLKLLHLFCHLTETTCISKKGFLLSSLLTLQKLYIFWPSHLGRTNWIADIKRHPNRFPCQRWLNQILINKYNLNFSHFSVSFIVTDCYFGSWWVGIGAIVHWLVSIFLLEGSEQHFVQRADYCGPDGSLCYWVHTTSKVTWCLVSYGALWAGPTIPLAGQTPQADIGGILWLYLPKVLLQWCSTFLMLWPFGIGFMLWCPPNIKLFHCYFVAITLLLLGIVM